MDTEQEHMVKALGARMAAIRRERDLTQDQVSELSGVDVQAIRRAENGRSALPYHRLQRIARALGVKLADLFDFDGFVPDAIEDPVEARLVAVYRSLPPRRRPVALRLVEVLGQPDPW